MSAPSARTGIIGCGNISPVYFDAARPFPALHIVACADLDPARAQVRAEQYGLQALSVEALLADPAIELVINLTIPRAHHEIGMAVLGAGKHLYNEKPLAIALEDGEALLDTAAAGGLLVGCAPDTFLGAGLQTCRKLIDDGWIGTPVAATAFMVCHGHEGWHPDPAFYYQRGGGPVFDMGPYYLTALVNLLGPIRRVAGSARVTFPERLITSEPRRGTRIAVEVPTHVAGLLDFASGAVGTMIMSFDVWAADLPRIEIYGTEGSLSVPDPNTFDGPVRLRRAGAEGWSDVPLSHGYAEQSRGLGVAELIHALRAGRPPRASGALAYHVLESMHALHRSSDESHHIDILSSVPRPEPLPLGLDRGELDG